MYIQKKIFKALKKLDPFILHKIDKKTKVYTIEQSNHCRLCKDFIKTTKKEHWKRN